MRILHAPLNIAGQPLSLSGAQRLLGYKSDVLVFKQNYLNYRCDINLHLENKPIFIKPILILINFIRCLYSYDIFHFHGGASLLYFNLDIPIYRIFGKKVIMQYWGSDCLQTDIAKNYTLYSENEFKKNFGKIDNQKKRKKLQSIEKKVNCTIVGDEALSVFSPQSLLVRKVLDLTDLPFIGVSERTKQIVIVHAPSNRNIKGTKYILTAIERLKREKQPIKFILVEKKVHTKAIEIYKKADIIVDDVLQGPYGILAMECMALGKPVICRIDDKLKKFYKNLPVVSANPETVYQELKKMIENPKLRHELGIQGRKYVEKNHDSLKIAKQLIKLYKDLYD